METPVPTWLEQSPTLPLLDLSTVSAQRRAINRELALSTFELIFDETVDRLSAGHPLRDIVNDYNESHPIPIDIAQYNRWILKDKERKNRFEEALEFSTYVLVDEMVRIADGEDNPLEDVQRSTIRIKARETKLKAYNRRLFGNDNSLPSASNSGPVVVNITQVESPYRPTPITIENPT